MIDRSDREEVLGGLNPGLRVPTLVLDDGRPLAESDAILVYFAEGTEYLPEDRYARAQVLQWMFFEQYSHEPNIAVLRFWAEAGIEGDRARGGGEAGGGYRALEAMERHLAGREFFVGERPDRSPTSRSTPTPTSPTRAASRWAVSRRSRRGWGGSRRFPGYVSDHGLITRFPGFAGTCVRRPLAHAERAGKFLLATGRDRRPAEARRGGRLKGDATELLSAKATRAAGDERPPGRFFVCLRPSLAEIRWKKLDRRFVKAGLRIQVGG